MGFYRPGVLGKILFPARVSQCSEKLPCEFVFIDFSFLHLFGPLGLWGSAVASLRLHDLKPITHFPSDHSTPYPFRCLSTDLYDVSKGLCANREDFAAHRKDCASIREGYRCPRGYNIRKSYI